MHHVKAKRAGSVLTSSLSLDDLCAGIRTPLPRRLVQPNSVANTYLVHTNRQLLRL